MSIDKERDGNTIMKEVVHSDYIEVSKLKGIKIFYENDLYDFAKLVLNIMDASDRYKGSSISKPTINGIANYYSWICGEKISSDQIVEIANQYGLNGNDEIDFDKNDKRRYMQPKIGSRKT